MVIHLPQACSTSHCYKVQDKVIDAFSYNSIRYGMEYNTCTGSKVNIDINKCKKLQWMTYMDLNNMPLFC